MTPEEFNLKLSELSKEYDKAVNLLSREYAFSNNTIRVGDIATDHIGSIRVEEIKYSLGSFFTNNLPQCVYVGSELKKDLTHTKKMGKRNIYQSNLKN